MNAPALVDGFGRVHTDLRISVTDRCNLRCTYCMPLDAVFRPREELLSYEEITRVAGVAAGLGIRTIRLTGGEPLVRSSLEILVRQLVAARSTNTGWSVVLCHAGLMALCLAAPPLLAAAALFRGDWPAACGSLMAITVYWSGCLNAAAMIDRGVRGVAARQGDPPPAAPVAGWTRASGHAASPTVAPRAAAG